MEKREEGSKNERKDDGRGWVRGEGRMGEKKSD